MSRVIYSLYIDVPEDELDFFDSKIIRDGELPTNINTKNELKKHYERLVECKREYANSIGADFKMFEFDEEYKRVYGYYKRTYPHMTTYNIINEFKILLLYEMASRYDEVLYLDFDTVPMTKESFFDVWDLKKGIAILSNNKEIRQSGQTLHDIKGTIRSPSAKYFNTMAMLEETDNYPQCNVVNTGIIGATKEHLDRLGFFDDIDTTYDIMKYLQTEDYKMDSMYPRNITDTFGYDNETIFSYKLIANDVPVQWLDRKWHYFYDAELHIPLDTKIIHAINKKFDFCWRALERKNKPHE